MHALACRASRPPLAANQHYCRNMVGPGSVDIEGGTLAMLAGLLGLILDRPVIDKTGIADYFEIHLKFSSDDSGGSSIHGRSRAPGCRSGRQTFPEYFKRFRNNSA